MHGSEGALGPCLALTERHVQVKELELNDNLSSVDNLLTFLETIFNGGSDFKCVARPASWLPWALLPWPHVMCLVGMRAVILQVHPICSCPVHDGTCRLLIMAVCSEPVRRCLARLTDAKWANSDILLVGPCCQPHPKPARLCSTASRTPGRRPAQCSVSRTAVPVCLVDLRRSAGPACMAEQCAVHGCHPPPSPSSVPALQAGLAGKLGAPRVQVSDGELRQPGQEVMVKLAGAKDKLGLRVHGLIVGSPEKKRADPAVLRALCTNVLPSGHHETLVTEFEGWASVAADKSAPSSGVQDVRPAPGHLHVRKELGREACAGLCTSALLSRYHGTSCCPVLRPDPARWQTVEHLELSLLRAWGEAGLPAGRQAWTIPGCTGQISKTRMGQWHSRQACQAIVWDRSPDLIWRSPGACPLPGCPANLLTIAYAGCRHAV